MDYDTMLFSTPEERAETSNALLEKMRETAELNFNAQLQEIQAIEAELKKAPKDADAIADRANRYPQLIERLYHARKALDDINITEQALNAPPVLGELLDMNTETNPRHWLIYQWLPANCLSMLTGEGGVGKSYLMLEVVSALAMGYRGFHLSKETLPVDFEANPVKTVWATWEDDADEVIRRLRWIESKLKWPDLDLISNALQYVDLKMHGPIWGPEMSEHVSVRATLLEPGYQLMRICEKHEAQLLVLDPCAGAFGGNENDRSAVRQFTSYLSGWAMQNNCAVMLLAHPPKSESAYSGSTDWQGSVRSFWNLGKREANEGDSYFSLIHEKSNYAMTQPEKCLAKIEQSGVWIETQEVSDDIYTS